MLTFISSVSFLAVFTVCAHIHPGFTPVAKAVKLTNGLPDKINILWI